MGEWHLEADVPSAEDAVHVRVLHDVDGCYGVMMEMPFGAHPVAVIGGGHRALRESSSASSRIHLGAHVLTCPVVVRVRPGDSLSCLTARCASVTNPACHPYSERHFAH